MSTAQKTSNMANTEANSAKPQYAISDLPELLRKTRKAKGFTLAEVSQVTGITVSTLSRIENGLFAPRADSLIQLMQWLSLEQSQLTSKPSPTHEDTMLKIALILREDPKLDEVAIKRLLQAWRPMYDFYIDKG